VGYKLDIAVSIFLTIIVIKNYIKNSPPSHDLTLPNQTAYFPVLHRTGQYQYQNLVAVDKPKGRKILVNPFTPPVLFSLPRSNQRLERLGHWDLKRFFYLSIGRHEARIPIGFAAASGTVRAVSRISRVRLQENTFRSRPTDCVCNGRHPLPHRTALCA